MAGRFSRLRPPTRCPVFFEAAAAGRRADHQGDSRGVYRQSHPLDARHHQRHQQLHPDPDDGVRHGLPEALREAQVAGFAEADPTLDINGWDAGHKAIILASLAYGFWVGTEKVYVEGIEKITATDIRFAAQLGYAIKLLAIIKAGKRSEIEVRVHPTLIPRDHVLASVKGVFNAIMVQGDIVGRDALLRTRRRAGPDLERGHQRPRGSRRRPPRAAQLLRLHAARPVRHLQADRPDRLAILPAHFRGRSAGRARPGRGHPRRARISAFPRSSSPRSTSPKACRWC